MNFSRIFRRNAFVFTLYENMLDLKVLSQLIFEMGSV